MQTDPIVDLIRRRTRAGWIDVFILFVVSVVISAVAGNARQLPNVIIRCSTNRSRAGISGCVVASSARR